MHRLVIAQDAKLSHKKPIRVYELMGEKNSLNERSREFMSLFHEGLQMYRKQQWNSAKHQFEHLLDQMNDDGPCKTYIERCKLLESHNLPADWDGVFTMSSK